MRSQHTSRGHPDAAAFTVFDTELDVALEAHARESETRRAAGRLAARSMASM